MNWTPLHDSACALGESPFWHPDEQALYWLDIVACTVLRTRGAGSAMRIERWPLPSEPGCMAPARSGGLVLGLRDGIYRARTWGAELQLLARAEHDTRTMRFNDGKCDPLGRFWAGTLNEAKDRASAALFCLDARGGATPTLTKRIDGATTANGLAFAPDARTLYWADTPSHAVRAWDWDAAANTLSGERVFARVAPKPAGWSAEAGGPYDGRPDGATVSADGHYWVAMFEGAQLLRFAPGGERVDALPVPAQCPTMPCFGGDDLRTLFVTSAAKGRSDAERARLPATGSVFWTRTETPGLPVNFFED
ncbi:SMP-30/gluconolactonase/LRE family protein [Variovorax sp. ZT4R33]|uniref:SMP-30/gluconolactonase/LRE family protein n=1 Tax=Variovorax sp. ZT4R33 TaxID=3443743 RepID=UPI003F454EBB